MIDDDNGTVRRLDWSEILPWLILFRCFRLAIRAPALVLSAIAILVTLIGWALFGYLLSGDPEIAAAIDKYDGSPWLVPLRWVPDWLDRPAPLPPQRLGFGAAATPAGGVDVFSRAPEPLGAGDPVVGSWEQLSRPLRRIFGWDLSWQKTVFLLLCGLWAIVVWAYFAGVVTRSAAVELAAGERLGWGNVIGYARSKWSAYSAAPLVPLVGVVFCSLPILLFALFLHSGWTVWIAGLVWWLLLAMGMLMALLLLGLLAGWPLMWATISTEGTDSFDAISRSYAYVYQRPLHYLFYVGVAAILGALGWLLVSFFAAAVVYLTYWVAAWTAGPEQVAAVATGGETLGTMGAVGAAIVRFWCDCVKVLAVGFLYSYFWVSSTAIYLLLRRDVDATEMDEVFLAEDKQEPFGLPPISADEAGAPVVNDEQPEEDTEG